MDTQLISAGKGARLNIPVIARLFFRYFITGRQLWGATDNATFLHDATVDYRARPYEKLTRARWRRVARRWAVLLTLGTLWALWAFVGSWAVLTLLTVLIVGSLSIGVPMAAHWWAAERQREQFIYPVHRIVCKISGQKFSRKRALGSVVLPNGFTGQLEQGEVPTPVRIYLPDLPMDDAMKRKLPKAVGGRLGMPNPAAHFEEVGAHPYMELLPQALPPKRVTLNDLREEMAASPAHQPVVGIANGARIVHMDFYSDSPHSLGSAPTGAGKSTLYKLIAMQRLGKGGYSIILDFKKWSHLRWAGRLPAGRVLIADRIPDIHDILVRVADELIWRKEHELHQEAELDALPTLDIFMEELGSLRDLLNDHWLRLVQAEKAAARTAVRRAKTAKDEDALDEAEETLAAANALPKQSPATQALKFGVNLGREFKIHFHFISQSIDANVAGGRNVRASFRTRFLARWDIKDWKMLAGAIPYVACPSGEPGVWAHVHGSEVEIIRVPLVTDADAVDYVNSSPAPALPMFHNDPVPTIEAQENAAIERLVTLREALPYLPADDSGDTLQLEGLRSASKRQGFPPRHGADQYVLSELLAWRWEKVRGRQINA